MAGPRTSVRRQRLDSDHENSGSGKAAGVRLAGKFLFEAGGNEGARTPTTSPPWSMAHQCGGDRANRTEAGTKTVMDVRCHGFVMRRSAISKSEVGAVAQATNMMVGAMLLRRGTVRLVVGRALEGAAAAAATGAKISRPFPTLFVENSGFLLEIEPIATIRRSHKPDGVPDHVEWPLVTGRMTWLTARCGHKSSNPPRAARKPGRFPAGGASIYSCRFLLSARPERSPGELCARVTCDDVGGWIRFRAT